MTNYIDLFFGFFNIFLGALMFIGGMGRIKLKKALSPKLALFFKIAGSGLVIAGFIKVIISYSLILHT